MRRDGATGLAILLGKLALFAVPLVMVFLGLEAGIRRHPDTLMRKRQFWEQVAPTTQTLILGSSHAQFGLRPDALGPNAFNLAGFSQTLRYDSALLAQSLQRMPNLQTVLLSVSYFTFQEELGAKAEPWRCWSYRDAWEIPVPAGVKPWDLRRWSRLLRIGNWRAVLQALRGFPLVEDLVPIGPDGWGAAIAPHPNQPQDSLWAQDRMGQWRETMDPSRQPLQIQRMASILEMARQAHLQIVLVATPVLAPLRQLESDTIRHRNAHLADSLAQHYGATWLDFQADSGFCDRDFVDMDHLGPDAARRLSQRIGDGLLLQIARDTNKWGDSRR